MTVKDDQKKVIWKSKVFNQHMQNRIVDILRWKGQTDGWIMILCIYLYIGAIMVVIDGSWIYNYLCNQWQSPLTLWVQIPLRRGVLDTTLCDKSLSVTYNRSVVSSTNKTDCPEITEKLLQVALNTINPTHPYT
jgi:hypothetical protein